MQGDSAKRTETDPAARSPKASEAKGKYTGISGFIYDLEYVECNTGNVNPEQALQE